MYIFSRVIIPRYFIPGALVLGTILAIASCLTASLVHYWEYIISPERLAIIKHVAFFVIL
jgi:hypothetical protein